MTDNIKQLKMPPSSLEQAFDLTVEYVTPAEIFHIRDALQHGKLIVSEHALAAAKDDAITALQIFSAIENGVPISKDLSILQTRQIGVNFEGRAGGSRKIRVKVSWDSGYYVVTVHAVTKIKRNSR